MSHVAKKGWQEKRERLDGDIDREESKCAESVADIEDCALDVVQLDLLMDVRLVLSVETLGRNLLLARCEELALVRVCLHEERGDERDDDREKAFEEKDMAPGVQPHRSDSKLRDLGQACSQEASEGTCQRTG